MYHLIAIGPVVVPALCKSATLVTFEPLSIDMGDSLQAYRLGMHLGSKANSAFFPQRMRNEHGPPLGSGCGPWSLKVKWSLKVWHSAGHALQSRRYIHVWFHWPKNARCVPLILLGGIWHPLSLPFTPPPPFEDSHVLPCIVPYVRLLVDGNWSTCWQDDRTTDAIVTATTISFLLRFTASSQDNQR